MKLLYVIFLSYTISRVECQINSKIPCSTGCTLLSECHSAHSLWVEYGEEPDICYFDQNYIPHICCPEPNNQKNEFKPKQIKKTCSKNCVLLYECPSPIFKWVLKTPSTSQLISSTPEYSNTPHICTEEKKVKKCPDMSSPIVLEPLIGHGYNADSENFEFMVGLSWGLPFEKFYACGGTLIHKLFVMTAAHCLYYKGTYTPLQYAIAGGGSLKNNNKANKIVSFSQHPDYQPRSKYYDIAILKLEKEENYQPACLPPPSYEVLPRDSVVAAGYGRTSFYGDISNRLLRADLHIYMQYNCSQYYGTLLDSQLCAVAGPTYLENKTLPVYSDLCQGDSGGPLLKIESDSSIQSVVVGVLSYGLPCGNGFPNVFTKVSYYYDWIMQKISPQK